MSDVCNLSSVQIGYAGCKDYFWRKSTEQEVPQAWWSSDRNYCVPGTALNILHILIHIIVELVPLLLYSFYRWETEAQIG